MATDNNKSEASPTGEPQKVTTGHIRSWRDVTDYMKHGRKHAGLALILAILLATSFTFVAYAQRPKDYINRAPVLVSPDNNVALNYIPELEWQGIRRSAGYEVAYTATNDVDFSDQTLIPLNRRTKSYTPETLEYGGYAWRVRALGSIDPGPWSEPFYFSVSAPEQIVPTPTPDPTPDPTPEIPPVPTPNPTPEPTPEPTPDPTPVGWTKPAWLVAGMTWQWQLDGTIDTSYDVDVYDIDYEVNKSVVDTLHGQGKKVICYVAVGSAENYRPDYNQFPASVMGNTNGWPGEKWLDIRQISVLQPIMEARFDICNDKGFDAIEPDLMDGYSNRTGFPLTAQDQIAYNTMIAEIAHERGLAVGLKNDVEQINALEPLFDFSVNEECAAYNECSGLAAFTRNNKPVFHAEYAVSVDKMCTESAKYNLSSIKKRLSLSAVILGTCY